MPQNLNPSLSLRDMAIEIRPTLPLLLITLGFVLGISGSIINNHQVIFFIGGVVSISFGSIWHTIIKYGKQTSKFSVAGTFDHSLQNRGWVSIILGIIISLFYTLLYWYPSSLGYSSMGNDGFISLFDPLSLWMKQKPATQWFAYGFLYTMAVLLLGFKFIYKYRGNRYQLLRTLSVMFFQLAFAFLIPEWMQRLNLPYQDLKNMWPLQHYFFEEWSINQLLNSGNPGIWLLIWGLLLIFIVSPILTYFYGKRWYCSWVCGCGGLAETAGDPFRHLSDKSLNAWKIERWLVHSVLVWVVLLTFGVIYAYLPRGIDFWLNKQTLSASISLLCLTGIFILLLKRNKWFTPQNRIAFYIGLAILSLLTILGVTAFGFDRENFLFISSYPLSRWYGFFIGALFSGVIGVGFYPLFGSRVWCRFGCPMAAILGLQQKWFSRFRISTNGAQCISCGQCSTYCEMGIDVKAYAQNGQDIIRASCVGCGICAAVCPRGVLKLENDSLHTKGNRDTDWYLKNNLFQ